MTTFALRAEAKADVDALMERLVEGGHSMPRWTLTSEDFDVLVEMSVDATLDELLAVIKTVPDGHIMFRTVQEATLATADFSDYVRV